MTTAAAALVTGGSGGIGRAIALALADAGHPVAITGRNQQRLDDAARAIEQRGVRAVCVPADLRDPAAAESILDAASAALGPLGILVNNAGTAPTAKFEATDDAMLDEVLDLHVRAPFRLIRAMLPALRERDDGVIVQLGSTAGLRGFPFTAAYTAAKHAMVGMTRVLALELARSSVRAYAVCPGFVDTDITRSAAERTAGRGKQTADEAMAAMGSMNRIGRMHTAEDVAAAVLHMCHDRPDGCVYELDSDPPRFVDP